jgi:hypothetical protein
MTGRAQRIRLLSRSPRVVAAIAVAFVLAALVPGVGNASSVHRAPTVRSHTQTTGSVVTATVPENVKAGDPVDNAAGAVLPVLRTAGLEGKAERSIDYDRDLLTIYTASAVSLSNRQKLQAAAAGVKVRFVHTKYATDALIREGARLAGLPGVASAGPTADYSGVQVSVRSGASGAKILTGRRDLQSSFPIIVQGNTQLAEATRNADTAPAFGGALVFRFTSATAGVLCSVGAGVRLAGTTINGITTAQHCGSGGWIGFESGAALGTFHHGKNAVDTQVLTGHGGSNRVWIGAWNSSSSRTVLRGEDPADGIRTCNDGGVTGEVCGSDIHVVGINQFINLTGLGTVGPGFFVLRGSAVTPPFTGRQCVVQGGDSGSPSYHYNADGRVTIHGFTVAADLNFSTTRCKGNPKVFPPGGNVSARSFAVNEHESLNDQLNVTLLTG